MSLDQLFQSFLERPLVAAGLLVKDQQIGRQAMHPPIGVGMEQLADQAGLPDLADGDQDQRQVTRNCVGPESCLPLAVVIQALGWCAQELIGKQQVTCQLLKATGFVRLNVQQLQLLLGRAPGEIHGPFDSRRVTIFVHQQKDLLACPSGCKHQGKLNALTRFQNQIPPQT